MASEITEHDQNASPSVHDDQNPNNGALVQGDANRGTKRPRPAADDDDDDDDKPGRERRKIEIKFIQDKSRRHITFSKRKAGIMKKVRVFHSLLCSAPLCPGARAPPTATQSTLHSFQPRRMGKPSTPAIDGSLTRLHSRPTNCPS